MTYTNDHNLHSIKDAISDMLKRFNLQQKSDEMRIMTHWNEIVGKLIANHTEKVFIKDKKIYLKVDSAPLRNELYNLKEGILDKINDGFSHKIVVDLVLY